jgi:hypothetical protein
MLLRPPSDEEVDTPRSLAHADPGRGGFAQKVDKRSPRKGLHVLHRREFLGVLPHLEGAPSPVQLRVSGAPHESPVDRSHRGGRRRGLARGRQQQLPELPPKAPQRREVLRADPNGFSGKLPPDPPLCLLRRGQRIVSSAHWAGHGVPQVHREAGVFLGNSWGGHLDVPDVVGIAQSLNKLMAISGTRH